MTTENEEPNQQEDEGMWDAFGDDEDGDSDDDNDNMQEFMDDQEGATAPKSAQTNLLQIKKNVNTISTIIANQFTKHFLVTSKTPLRHRYVGLVSMHTNNSGTSTINDCNDCYNRWNELLQAKLPVVLSEKQISNVSILDYENSEMSFATTSATNGRKDEHSIENNNKNGNESEKSIQNDDFKKDDLLLDACIVIITSFTDEDENNDSVETTTASIRKLLEKVNTILVHGGYCIVIKVMSGDKPHGSKTSMNHPLFFDPYSMIWKYDTMETLHTTTSRSSSTCNNHGDSGYHTEIIGVMKWMTVPCQNEMCPWLPRKFNTTSAAIMEMERLCSSTVCLSVQEQKCSKMNPSSLDKAVIAMERNGVVIIPGLLRNCSNEIHRFGQAAIHDLHTASDLIQKDTNNNDSSFHLYHNNDNAPNNTTNDHSNNNDKESTTASTCNALSSSQSSTCTTAYRELSMREDYRADIRYGPKMNQLRQCNNTNGNVPITVKASDIELPNEFCLRGHANLLEIVRRVMNPVDPTLSKGNFGRYNFDGTGPNGSHQTLFLGVVGAIISITGSADQAIHADTAHLFENQNQLPAHYINFFTPATHSEYHVGQTAFLQQSHQLQFTARYCPYDNDSNTSATTNYEMYEQYLVRPKLEVGDVVLFDCRILHFGMSNRKKLHNSSGIFERPILYCNATMHWFTDPKNWDNHHRIFPEL